MQKVKAQDNQLPSITGADRAEAGEGPRSGEAVGVGGNRRAAARGQPGTSGGGRDLLTDAGTRQVYLGMEDCRRE